MCFSLVIFHKLSKCCFYYKLVLTGLYYGSSTLAGLAARQLNRLQSIVNSAAHPVYSARRSEHVSPLLQDLHWLRVPEWIDFRLAVLVYRCMNGTAPHYLGSELQRVAEIESRRRLLSASSPSLDVPRSLRKTIGDRAFLDAAAKSGTRYHWRSRHCSQCRH